MPSPVSAVSGIRARDMRISFAASPTAELAVISLNEQPRPSSFWSEIVLSHTALPAATFSLMVPVVVPLPSGATREPSLALIARHALLDAPLLTLLSAALLLGMICNSPLTRRRPMHHSHTFPFMSQMPSMRPLWLHGSGPVPVRTRAVLLLSCTPGTGIASQELSEVSLP